MSPSSRPAARGESGLAAGQSRARPAVHRRSCTAPWEAGCRHLARDTLPGISIASPQRRQRKRRDKPVWTGWVAVWSDWRSRGSGERCDRRNDCRHRAAAQRDSFQNFRCRPLWFTAWFGQSVTFGSANSQASVWNVRTPQSQSRCRSGRRPRYTDTVRRNNVGNRQMLSEIAGDHHRSFRWQRQSLLRIQLQIPYFVSRTNQ